MGLLSAVAEIIRDLLMFVVAMTALLIVAPSFARAEIALHVSEYPIGTLPDDTDEETLVASPDFRHFAGIVRQGQTQSLVVDGKMGPAFDRTSSKFDGNLEFSADSRHFAYSATRNGATVRVIDGKVGYPGDQTPLWVFSPDGGHFAYAAGSFGGAYVVMDGERSARFDGVLGPVFSRTGASVAFKIYDNHEQYVMLNGRPESRFDEVGIPVLSPDGRRLAYTTKKGNQFSVVVDHTADKPPSPSSVFGDPVFSEDSRHIAYCVTGAGLTGRLQHFIVVDHRIGQPMDGWCGVPIFSPDGRHVAYPTTFFDDKTNIYGSSTILDGKLASFQQGDQVYEINFSPDSQRLAYRVGTSDHSLIAIIDGKRGPAYDDMIAGILEIRFSPDSRHTAYAARQGRAWFVVMDGRPGPTFDWIGLPFTPIGSVLPVVFSPNSQHIAYEAQRITQQFVVLDGHEGPAFDEIAMGVGQLAFSEDSVHFAYQGRRGRNWFVVLDGQLSRPYEKILFSHNPYRFYGQQFIGASTLRVMAVRAKVVYVVDLDLSGTR